VRLPLPNIGANVVLLGLVAVLLGITAAIAADYHIDFIEIDGRYVNIHFNTAPNRSYALQYRSVLNSTNTTGWSNLFVVPAQPFQNHHVVSDLRTNQQRYYRLRVTQ
jgi:hypothetical protein